MRWTRNSSGHYTAGPYKVEQHATALGNQWRATGPELDSTWLRKADAQKATLEVAKRRIGDGTSCTPVVGDIARVLNQTRKDPRGKITAVLTNGSPTQQPLYVVRYIIGGGRRVCFRHEIEVLLP